MVHAAVKLRRGVLPWQVLAGVMASPSPYLWRPRALLMQVPLVGPLVYVPMQFAAAWLLHLLLTDVPTRPSVAASQGLQVTLQHGCF